MACGITEITVTHRRALQDLYVFYNACPSAIRLVISWGHGFPTPEDYAYLAALGLVECVAIPLFKTGYRLNAAGLSYCQQQPDFAATYDEWIMREIRSLNTSP